MLAAKLIQAQVTNTVTGEVISASFTSVMNAFDTFDGANSLQEAASRLGYNISSWTDPAVAVIDFRGIPINLEYAGVGDERFTLTMLGETKDFTSFNDFKDYLKDNQDGLLRKLLEATVRETPFDSVAGNPNSLLTRMLDSSYNVMDNNFIFRPYFSTSQIEGATTFAVHMPLGWGWDIDEDKRIIFDVPLTYQNTEGSGSYEVQMGLAYKQRIYGAKGSDEISFGLGARLGVAGSVDLISGGVIWGLNASLISRKYLTPAFSIGMINSIGYYDDYALRISGYDIDYKLALAGTKNGIDLKYNINPEWAASLSFIDTRFLSNKLYISWHDEVKLSADYIPASDNFVKAVNCYASYLFGERNFNGFKIGFGLKF